MITPAFSLTATERILPRLTIDFTTASLDSRIALTRTGATATRTNSSGYVETVAANTPRFDYDPVTLACRGLMIEEERTNRILYSQDFSDVNWTKSNTSVTGASQTSPDGTNNGFLFAGDGATANHFLRQFEVLNQTKTSSIYAKKGTLNFLQIGFDGYLGYANFDLNAGTVTTTASGATATISPAGNGWYRCACTANTTAATTTRYSLISSGSSGRFQSWATSGDMYVWGAQIEAGAFATSYIPTVASQVTRTADVATMTGTNFSAWWNSTEGAAVIQTIPRAASGTRPAIQFDDNTANEIITLRGSVADPQLYVVDAGAAQATLDAGTITANTAYKLSGAWKASSFATSINGGAAVAQASGTLPTVTQARLGGDGTNYLNGWLQNLRYWPQRIIDTEVQAFSK